MNNLGACFKGIFTVTGCIFLLLGCGKAAPELSGVSAQQRASSGKEFSASMPNGEVIEGTFPIVNGVPVSDGKFTQLLITIQFNRALSQDTRIYLNVDQSRSTCPENIKEQFIVPGSPELVAPGEDKVSFTLKVYPDADVEANCENGFKLKMVDAIDLRTIPVEGRMILIDDDVSRNFEVSSEYGDQNKISLMGSREYDGRTFKVEQLGQRQARFTIEGKYLHFLLPGSPNYNEIQYVKSGLEDFVFRITPSNGEPSFDVNVIAYKELSDVIDDFSRGGRAYSTEEGDEADFEYKQQHFLIKDIVLNGFWDNYFYTDLSKISWTFKTTLPTNVLKLHPAGVNESSGFIESVALNQEEIGLINKAGAYVFDSDNRTLRINSEIIPLIEKSIYHYDMGNLNPVIDVCESALTTSLCQTQSPILHIRPTLEKLRLKVFGIDERHFKEKERFYIVVQDVTPQASNHVTRLISLSASDSELAYFYPGRYKLKLVDSQGEYQASADMTLYQGGKDTSVSLAADKIE